SLRHARSGFVVWSRLPPSLPHVPFRYPSEMREHGDDAVAIPWCHAVDGRAAHGLRVVLVSWHPRALKLVFERVDGDVQHRGSLRPVQLVEVVLYHRFPHVLLKPRFLLGCDGALLELGIGPPVDASAIEAHGLGE